MSNDLRFWRRPKEGVVIGGRVKVTLARLREDKAEFAVVAPMDVTVHRTEVAKQIGQHIDPQLVMHPIEMLKHACRKIIQSDEGMAEADREEDRNGARAQLEAFMSVADRAMWKIREDLSAGRYKPKGPADPT